jgi:hypothetical protein
MVAVLENKIFYANAIKTTNMKYILLIASITTLWMAYEIWRAPMMDESGKVLKPGKKLSDLWKKKK